MKLIFDERAAHYQMKKLLTISIGLSIVIAAAFVAAESDLFSNKTAQVFSSTNLYYWLAASSLSILIFFLLGAQLKASLKPSLDRMSLSTAFHLSASNTLLNYFPGKAGLLAKGAYLKKTEGIAVLHYAEALIVTSLISIGVAVTLGTMAIATNETLTTYTSEIIENIAPEATIAILLALIMAPLLLTLLIKNKKFLLHSLKRVKNTAKLNIAITAIGIFLASAARLHLCFISIGYFPSVSGIVFIQFALSLSFLVSITPGNLGVKESILVLAATCALIDPKAALVAGILDRLAAMIPTFIIGPISSSRLLLKVTEKKSNLT